MKRWPTQEEQLLTGLYRRKTNAEIARLLNKTPSAIAHKLRCLHLKRPYSPTIRKCLRCGKEFHVNPRQVRRGGGKYCSRYCTYIARKTQVTKKCIVCGKEYVVKESKRYKTARFCSSKCWGQYRWLENKVDISELFEKLKKSRLPVADFAEQQGHYYATVAKAIKRTYPGEYGSFIDSRTTKSGSKYEKGRAFEYETRDYFKKMGYFVLRSPRSLGPVDLVAIKIGEILFIQCKLRKRYFTKKESAILVSLAKSVGAKSVLAFKHEHKITLRFISQ